MASPLHLWGLKLCHLSYHCTIHTVKRLKKSEKISIIMLNTPTLHWAMWIRSTPQTLFIFLLLSFHLGVGLSSGPFSSGFPLTLSAYFISSIRNTSSTYLIFLDLIIRIICIPVVVTYVQKASDKLRTLIYTNLFPLYFYTVFVRWLCQCFMTCFWRHL